jgi:hypothetical protein
VCAYSNNSVPDASEGVLLPSQKGILLGRGKRAQLHPGNIRLNLLLEEKLEGYDTSKMKKKREVAFSVIRYVKNRGGCFRLKGEGAYWNEVSNEIARKKIAHNFRTIRQRLSEQSGDAAGGARKVKRGAATEAAMLSLPKEKRQGVSHDYT